VKEKRYDVFLSYNSEDAEAVEQVAAHLHDRAGLRPWLDKWDLVAGESWMQGLEIGITASKSCAVFVGGRGEGPWQKKECAAVLDRQAKNHEYRVIPVLLPGASVKPELPLFMAGNKWVEFRSIDDENALWQLECGIRGKPPGRKAPMRADRFFPSQSRPLKSVKLVDLIYPGGALEVDSRFYIKRAADKEVFEEIKKPRGLVTIRGARQTGKTSLIYQAKAGLKRSSIPLRPVLVDFQAFLESNFSSTQAIWQTIATEVALQLKCRTREARAWNLELPYTHCFSEFLDRYVFEDNDSPVVLCLDEIDRIFASPLKNAFFPSIRFFYNQGAHDRTWKNVRWLISTCSEPSFFIKDLTQSPFNIGLRVELNSFSIEEITEFAWRHGLSLKASIVERIFEYVGGRPYLVHLLLYHLVSHTKSENMLFDAKTAGGGVFLDHLQHFHEQFQEDPELRIAMKELIKGKGCEDVKLAHRLEAAGLVRRDADFNIVLQCGLYRDYFNRVL
jgi:hypothetical protein